MAFKIRKEGDNYNLPVLSLICDDVSDLNIILEEVEELIPYSECYVTNTSEKYVLNSLGEWKKINESTGGTGGSGGGSAQPVLQDKTITENGSYTADEGFDGLGTVEVNVAGESAVGETYEDELRAMIQKEKIIMDNFSFPSGLTTIGSSIFISRELRGNLVIPEGVTLIEEYAFSTTKSLESVVFPSTLVTLKTLSFYNAIDSGSMNKTVTFKGTPDTIGAKAFDRCSSLKTINVPWAEGEVANAPWGATNATINYNYTGE